MADDGTMDKILIADPSQPMLSNLEHPFKVNSAAQTPNPSPEGRRAKISGWPKLEER
jgi:hypothetical protein